MGCYLILYSVGRFLIEFLRGDPRGSVGPLSTAQFISVFTLLFGAWLIYSRQKKQQNPDLITAEGGEK